MSVHVGPQSETCTALVTPVGSLSSVPPLLLLPHQDPVLDDHLVVGLSVAGDEILFLRTGLRAEA